MGVTKALGPAVKQIPTLLAIVAAVTLILTPLRTTGLVLAAIALAGTMWRGTVTDFARTTPAQLILLFGLLSVFREASTSPFDLGLTAAAAALSLVIVMQPAFAAAMNRPRIAVANLPGYHPPRRALLAPKTLFRANAGLLALTLVVAAAGWPAWLVVGPVAVVMAGYAVVAVRTINAKVRGQRGETRLRAAIERYQPAFALYFSAPDDTDYHVHMWLPYLERIGEPFVIILREPKALRPLAAATRTPVIYCPSVAAVDEVVTSSMKACFYVNNGAKNVHMVRFNQMTHIQMLHGDSDKASSFNPVTAMFDRVFVAGQAGIDRYAANGVPLPLAKFDIVGRPQVESVEPAREHIRDITEKVVLYASTWIGLYTDANYCSLPIGEKIVTELLERKATVILRPHPYARRDPGSVRHLERLHEILAEDRESTGREHVFGAAATTQMTLFEAMNQADVLISDVSGVASDFLQSGKPFAMTDMVGAGAQAFEESFPLAKGAYVIDQYATNIDDVLDNLLEEDPLEDTRREIKAYYLGDFDDAAYADRFVACARSYVLTPDPTTVAA